MPREVPMPRGFRRRLWLLLILLPATLLALPNAWLSSPFGTRWLARKIHHRTHLDTRVDSATITPWGGLTINGIRLAQPPRLAATIRTPLVRIARVNVTPVWRAWLRGNPETHRIEIDSPHATIPAELLLDLAETANTTTPRQQPQSPTPTPAAAHPTPQPPSPPQPTPNPPAQNPPATPTNTPATQPRTQPNPSQPSQ
ncbi:MAG: hypothetical protein ACQCXQ_09170, partial [Verrucomicrobiales bacterium]